MVSILSGNWQFQHCRDMFSVGSISWCSEKQRMLSLRNPLQVCTTSFEKMLSASQVANVAVQECTVITAKWIKLEQISYRAKDCSLVWNMPVDINSSSAKPLLAKATGHYHEMLPEISQVVVEIAVLNRMKQPAMCNSALKCPALDRGLWMMTLCVAQLCSKAF